MRVFVTGGTGHSGSDIIPVPAEQVLDTDPPGARHRRPRVLRPRRAEPRPRLFVIDGGGDALNHRHASIAATSVLDSHRVAAYSESRSRLNCNPRYQRARRKTR
jgi:hypothetical protein